MKRLKLLISIVSLAICISALTFGVLAAIQNTNAVIGKIAFNAADCYVEVSVNVEDALDANKNTYVSEFSDATRITDDTTWKFTKAMYFDDVNVPTEPAVPDVSLIKPIKINFVIKNVNEQSAVVVTASNSDTNLTEKCNLSWTNNNSEIAPSQTLVLTLTISPKSNSTFTLTNVTFANIEFRTKTAE